MWTQVVKRLNKQVKRYWRKLFKQMKIPQYYIISFHLHRFNVLSISVKDNQSSNSIHENNILNTFSKYYLLYFVKDSFQQYLSNHILWYMKNGLRFQIDNLMLWRNCNSKYLNKHTYKMVPLIIIFCNSIS